MKYFINTVFLFILSLLSLAAYAADSTSIQPPEFVSTPPPGYILATGIAGISGGNVTRLKVLLHNPSGPQVQCAYGYKAHVTLTPGVTVAYNNRVIKEFRLYVLKNLSSDDEDVTNTAYWEGTGYYAYVKNEVLSVGSGTDTNFDIGANVQRMNWVLYCSPN